MTTLTCPSCGSTATIAGQLPHFGTEFTCKHCGVVSVLVVDHVLLARTNLQLLASKICLACGRLASAEARFCQCGASLVRLCFWCYTEVPVDHRRCDNCGWLDPSFDAPSPIEGAWQVILQLLEQKMLNEANDPFANLFYSIWSDKEHGPAYHQR
jgi:predicted RNA-binding Zn-ribbon protein involved in translation (DUF1610 family)